MKTTIKKKLHHDKVYTLEFWSDKNVFRRLSLDPRTAIAVCMKKIPSASFMPLVSSMPHENIRKPLGL